MAILAFRFWIVKRQMPGGNTCRDMIDREPVVVRVVRKCAIRDMNALTRASIGNAPIGMVIVDAIGIFEMEVFGSCIDSCRDCKPW